MKRLDLSDALLVMGLLLLAGGAGWIYPPAGLLIPGAALFGLGVWLARAEARAAQAER